MPHRDSCKIAAIIPCWNEEKLLPRMLDSLVAQSFQDWQVFCVDDCSTDNTAKVILSYQAKDSRIHYICRDREPKGGQTCRNIGLEQASNAELVCFFDADDFVAPYCFEQRVRYMELHPELDCGIFPMLSYRKDLQETDGYVYGIKSFDDDLVAMLYMALQMAISTNTYRVRAMQKYHLICDEKVITMQDSDLSFQLILSGMKYDYATEAKADYFYHIGNDGVASTIMSKDKWPSHVYLMEKVANSIEQKYGTKYDQQLAVYYALVIRKIGINPKAYPALMQLPWIKQHSLFRSITRLYQVTKIEKLWGLFFFPYRQDVIRLKVIWKRQMASKRKQLLE